MSIVIIGGKLQGTEAAYLAKMAGIESILIDRNPEVPARDLATRFVCADVLCGSKEAEKVLRDAEFVLPAMENQAVLDRLVALSGEYGFALVFDAEAYRISSSKIESDRLLRQHGIPAPRYYSELDPKEARHMKFIVKPSDGSGSGAVRYLESSAELDLFLAGKGKDAENWVAQEYLEGRQFSVEVIGVPGNYRTYAVTELYMDEAYDCRRVTAPADIPENVADEFAATAKKLAEILKLKGIMDLEAVYHDGILKILEIDARLPSQTPTAVLCSSGMNFVEELRDIIVHGAFRNKKAFTRYSSYEHILVRSGEIEFHGEHIMASGRPLRLVEGFCGADKALTDKVLTDKALTDSSEKIWRATVINTSDNLDKLREKEARMYERIRNGCG